MMNKGKKYFKNLNKSSYIEKISKILLPNIIAKFCDFNASIL